MVSATKLCIVDFEKTLCKSLINTRNVKETSADPLRNTGYNIFHVRRVLTYLHVLV